MQPENTALEAYKWSTACSAHHPVLDKQRPSATGMPGGQLWVSALERWRSVETVPFSADATMRPSPHPRAI